MTELMLAVGVGGGGAYAEWGRGGAQRMSHIKLPFLGLLEW